MLVIRFQEEKETEQEMNAITNWLNKQAIYWEYGRLEDNAIVITNLIWSAILPKGNYYIELRIIQEENIDEETRGCVLLKTKYIKSISYV